MFNMDIKKELLQDALGGMWYTHCMWYLFVLRLDDTRSRDLAVRLIIKYEDDNPLHVETQKDFDVVCNRDIDAFCQGIS
jgi:hypothetical protein